VKDSVDVQLNNVIIDVEPASFGLNKISRPIGVRGLDSRAEEILAEVVLATVNPVDKVKTSISINGIILTREIRPSNILEYNGLYWISTVYDVTELLRNRLNPLYQRLKIHYQGSDINRIGYVSVLAVYEASDMETTYTYASGLDKISKNHVYRIAKGIDFKDDVSNIMESHMMVYSSNLLDNLEVCKTNGGCMNTSLKPGFSELKFRNTLLREISLRHSGKDKKNSVLVTNNFNLHSFTDIPIFELKGYEVTTGTKNASTFINIEFSVKGKGEGKAQFILIDEGLPVGRARKQVSSGSDITLSFRLKTTLKNPLIRILFTKYSKNWIFNYRLTSD
jgi:hypothetical protein